MESTVTIDLRQVGRGLEIPLVQIQAAVELLDEGNTVPFITRYRKDQTGGLDEEQIREIQDRLAKLRLLADRKQTILRSIESQGKLTEKLQKQILSATTAKRLEDLYLPFKPKKQTLATLARSRGLELLAREILEAAPNCLDLDARAADFVNRDRQVPTAADALLGAGHILAEQFSEQAELRGRLRDILQRTGFLVCSRLPPDERQPEEKQHGVPAEKKPPEEKQHSETQLKLEFTEVDEPAEETSAEETPAAAEEKEAAVEASAATMVPSPGEASSPEDATILETAEGQPPTVADGVAEPAGPPKLSSAARRKLARQKAKQSLLEKRELLKKKIEEKTIKAFRDYFDFREALRQLPPHRVLAINRGEREKVLRVKIESNVEPMTALLDELLVPPGHPHADYLRGCARDALARLILPGLERDIRRELTDRAELHAVSVFARNLRNLLLQPPVRHHRLLAVDPGFRSGCKLVALDEFGTMLENGVIYLVSKPDRRDQARQKALELIEKHQLTVVVIGNGTACRHAEDFFCDLIEKEFQEKGRDMAYVIVNEAGASVYSTSRLGREEFPDFDATVRGAISIGRRLQDPLSELVKIDPANIGVGLYQHDVKAKHLRVSLDDVVESCVNYVGVDVNTASPALLRYVSGLNQLTAHRLYEYRREHGPFRVREQLRDVPGLGEATFVQAAGFLKIPNGDNPLDATWIHPESYEAATKALERLAGSPADLRNKETATALAERIAKVDIETMAKELAVGMLTLKDILAQLVRPGRDPREDLPAPVFKRGVIKLEDLSVDMELSGTVLNVVDFGCFIDIGMHDSGLVHVSRMANRYVRDPHDVVAVGDTVHVWVIEIDKERRRVSLTMVPPGERAQPHHGNDRPARAKPEGQAAPSGDRPHGRRPDRLQGQNRQQRPARSGDGQPAPQSGQGQRRPPQGQGREQHGSRPPQGHGRPPQNQYRPPRPAPKPKPVIPITEEMKAGKTPMRTFSDLLQFYQQQEPEPASTVPAMAAVDPPHATAEQPVEQPAEQPVERPVEQPATESVAAEEPSAPRDGE
jgi:transcriptional accessory protein Tex/SPT6